MNEFKYYSNLVSIAENQDDPQAPTYNNHPQAQLYLGIFYYERKFIKRNINKSIEYLALATGQNVPEA